MYKLGKLKEDTLFYIFRNTNLPITKPERVTINLTLKCNLSCIMCRTCYDVPNELTTNEIKKIIDEIAEWGVKTFNPIGGEAFVRKDIIKILSYAAEKNLNTTITTNGTLINEKIAEEISKINSKNLTLIFSIDGLKDTHNSIRGIGTFERTINAIKLIRKYDKERRFIAINCIISSRNLNELVDMVKLAEFLDVDKIQFLHLFNHDKEVEEAMWIKEEQLPLLDKAIDELCKYAKITKVQIGNSIEDLKLMKLYYRGKLTPEKAKCYNGFVEFYINSNGDGLMCDSHLNFIADTFGNTRKMTLKEMWRSKKALEMRKKVINCKNPCLQGCYLRRDSDSLIKIVNNFIKNEAY